MAFTLEKGDRCSLCGTADWEWEPSQGGRKFAYEATEQLCQGCLRIHAAQETSGNKPGVNVILTPTNTVEHAKRLKRAEDQWLEEMNRKARP